MLVIPGNPVVEPSVGCATCIRSTQNTNVVSSINFSNSGVSYLITLLFDLLKSLNTHVPRLLGLYGDSNSIYHVIVISDSSGNNMNNNYMNDETVEQYHRVIV